MKSHLVAREKVEDVLALLIAQLVQIVVDVNIVIVEVLVVFVLVEVDELILQQQEVNHTVTQNSSATIPNRSSDSKLKTFTSLNSLYSSEIYYLKNDIYSEYYLKTLMVNTITLNLRKGPSTDFGILEKIKQISRINISCYDWRLD